MAGSSWVNAVPYPIPFVADVLFGMQLCKEGVKIDHGGLNLLGQPMHHFGAGLHTCLLLRIAGSCGHASGWCHEGGAEDQTY